jgi:ribosome biogenesis GTPase
LRRTSQYGRKRAKKTPHIIVANLDALIIVSAAKEPPIWPKLVDTYLVIAEAAGIQPLVCVNKIDLVEDRMPILELLAVYERIGYDTLVTSAATGEGVEALRAWMKGKISAVAGLSCVGKSALLNAIQPGLRLRTGGYNQKRHEGRHTTVGAQLLKLEFGGFVADTPGIRDLSLMDIEPRVMDSYFPEMSQLRGQCDNNPCYHLDEVNCAVKAAVQSNQIAESRYKSYCELRTQIRN